MVPPRNSIPNARTERGMVAISADYRVKRTHGVTPFECVEDGRAAIAFLRRHAERLGIDPSRICAAGGSAGGHVAACTACRADPPDATGSPDATELSVPNALALFNPCDRGCQRRLSFKAMRTKRHRRRDIFCFSAR